MMRRALAVVAWACAGLAAGRTQPHELTIDTGLVRGERVEQGGKAFLTFKGIPYAAGPVGRNRFRAPRRPSNWRGTMDATKWPRDCAQAQTDGGELGGPSRQTSEHCLFLNVFAPADQANSSYPVLVWLHGGGFQSGGSADYKQEPILRHFVSLGVVFVSLNYRLGPFGFLATGDGEVAGNMGLRDQMAALQWVQRNADVFQGDADRVTLIGHGSGAGAASLLTLSPWARGLFRSAILLSGTALTPGTVRDTAVNATWLLQETLNCRAFNSSVLVDCLQHRSAEDILSALRPRVKYDEYEEWVPRVDGEGGVLPNALEELLLRSHKVPILLGTTRNESALRLLVRRKGFNMTSISRDAALRLVRNLTGDYAGHRSHELIVAASQYEYVETRRDPAGRPSELGAGLLELFADFWHHAPTSRLASVFSGDADVFLYSFDHAPTRSPSALRVTVLMQ